MEIGAGSSQGLTGKMSKKGVLLEDKESRACDVEDKKRKKKPSTPTLMVMKWCQAEKCAADLTEAKAYYRRHKVCEVHSKCPNVLVAGLHQRFCQQCSRFHELWEFDDAKRSCRRRLAGHNERRRKSAADQCQPCRGVPLRAGQAEG